MSYVPDLNSRRFTPHFKANPMPKEQALYLDSKLREADSVDIFCHASTDEDAFNSAKTMYLYLKQIGKQPRIIASNNPDLYGYDSKKYNILLMKNINENTSKADLALCVDFSKNERIMPSASKYLHRFSEDKIIGLDHHAENEFIIKDTKRITQSYDSVSKMPLFKPVNYYIDSTSKSCSAIIYRFFEALNEKLSMQQLSSIFCGMCDDMTKPGLLEYKKPFGKYVSILSDDVPIDSNTIEVYSKVSSTLSVGRKELIIQHLDILPNLSEDENRFMKRLFNGVKFSKNGKFAYFVIAPDDKDWLKFGGDTNRTSAMIRDFRVRLLKNNPEDKLISRELREKLKNVEVTGIFYSDYDEGAYKNSVHSKKDYVAKYQHYIKENLYSGLMAGGHLNRGGGRLNSLDEEECTQWVNYFKIAADNVTYD